MNDAEAKRMMLGIADGYDRLAERAEKRGVFGQALGFFASMGKAAGVMCLAAIALMVPANAGSKIDFRACKARVMQDARYKSRVCGTQCAAAIKRCMDSGGKID